MFACKRFSLDVNVCVRFNDWAWFWCCRCRSRCECVNEFFFFAERKRMIYDVNNALHTNRHRIRGCYFSPLTPMNFPARNEFHCVYVWECFHLSEKIIHWMKKHTHTHTPEISTDIHLTGWVRVCVCTKKIVGNVTAKRKLNNM